MCQRVRVVRVRRYRQALWWGGIRLLPLGTLSLEGRCRTCGHRTSSYRGRPPAAGIGWAPDSDLGLVAAVPHGKARHGRRASVTAGGSAISEDIPLDADDRVIHLCGPLVVANRRIEQRLGEMDGRTGSGLALAVVGPWVPVCLGFEAHGAAQVFWMMLAGIVFAAGLTLAAHGMITGLRRYLEREFGEYLAETMAPLNPTPGELQDAMAVLRGNGLRIGRVLRPRWLMREIREFARTARPVGGMPALLQDDCTASGSHATFRATSHHGKWHSADHGSQAHITSVG